MPKNERWGCRVGEMRRPAGGIRLNPSPMSFRECEVLSTVRRCLVGSGNGADDAGFEIRLSAESALADYRRPERVGDILSRRSAGVRGVMCEAQCRNVGISVPRSRAMLRRSGSVKCETRAAVFADVLADDVPHCFRSEYEKSGLRGAAGGARTRDQWIFSHPPCCPVGFPCDTCSRILTFTTSMF